MKLSLNGLTISDVSEAQSLLLEALGDWDNNKTLDITNVHSIDMCGIQLLLSFQKSLHLLGYTLKLSGVSDFIKNSIQLSGCAEALRLNDE